MGREGRGRGGARKGRESDPPSSFMLIPTLPVFSAPVRIL